MTDINGKELKEGDRVQCEYLQPGTIYCTVGSHDNLLDNVGISRPISNFSNIIKIEND